MTLYDQSSTFRRDIEGLRGIAILIVVLYHCGLPGVSGGFVGVDVFFVLSGFLITEMLVREVQQTSTLNLVEFYSRRARRLMPAFALTLMVTLLVGVIFLPPHELESAARAGRAAVLNLSNVFFDRIDGNYFGPNVQANPLLHTWSLSVEEQFYVFWPLLIFASFRWWRSRKALALVLAGLTLISLGIGIWFTARGGTFAFYELPARAWEFGIGGLAALMPRGRVKFPVGWWLAFGWIGLLAILSTTYTLSIMGSISFPGWIALLPTLGTVALLIVGIEHPNRGVGVVLAAAPLQLLGKLSYSWYLWHWPFLIFSAVLFPGVSLPGKLVAAAAALVVAGISYYYVEHPIRFHPVLRRRPALSLGLAGAVIVCSLGVSLFSLGFSRELAQEPKVKTIMAAMQNNTMTLDRPLCSPSLETADVKVCHFGKKNARTHIVLFGDSHAMHWFKPLENIAETNGWQLTSVVKSGCPAFDLRPSTLGLKHMGRGLEYNAACARWRMEALKTIVALRPTLVLLGSATTHLGQDDEHNFSTPSRPSLDELREGTKLTLQALKTLQVVVMRDLPHFPYEIPGCLLRSLRYSSEPESDCEANRSDVLNPAAFKFEQEGASGMTHVQFLDFTDLLCHARTCKPVHGNTVVYRDHDHLTESFTIKLTPALNLALHTILNTPEHRWSTWSDAKRG